MSCRLSSYFRLAKLALLKPTSFPAFVFRSVHSNFILRPYQEQCIQSCVEALNSGVSRIGVSAPTGSGKTTIFVSLLGRLPATKSGAGRALIIVSSVELARQAAEQVTRIFPDLRVEIEQGQKYKATGAADV
jgi:ATP-dependent helicase IRC3